MFPIAALREYLLFEQFGKITLEHRVSIVIGLFLFFFLFLIQEAASQPRGPTQLMGYAQCSTFICFSTMVPPTIELGLVVPGTRYQGTGAHAGGGYAISYIVLTLTTSHPVPIWQFDLAVRRSHVAPIARMYISYLVCACLVFVGAPAIIFSPAGPPSHCTYHTYHSIHTSHTSRSHTHIRRASVPFARPPSHLVL